MLSWHDTRAASSTPPQVGLTSAGKKIHKEARERGETKANSGLVKVHLPTLERGGSAPLRRQGCLRGVIAAIYEALFLARARLRYARSSVRVRPERLLQLTPLFSNGRRDRYLGRQRTFLIPRAPLKLLESEGVPPPAASPLLIERGGRKKSAYKPSFPAK